MKRLVSIGMLVMLGGILLAAAPTQDSNQKKQGYEKADEKPPMFYVIHEFVKPAMTQQYEEATKKLVKALSDHKVNREKVNFFTVHGPEMGYTYVIPLKDFSDMDRAHKDWEGAIEKIGMDTWEKTAKKADECVSHRSSVFAMMRSDLSYTPAHGAIPEDEVEYIGYAFYYATPGMEKDLEAVAKDFGKLHEEKNLPGQWTTYQILSGDDLPLYVVAQPGRSKIELLQRKERNLEACGKDGEYLNTRVMETIRRFEEKEAWKRPDLSFMPEKEMAAGANDR